MVFGLVRHRLHVPLSVLCLALTTAGYFLGHGHGGRSFPHTAHGTMASLLIFYLAAQGGMGIFLKLHIDFPIFVVPTIRRRNSAGQRFQSVRLRPLVLLIHGIVGAIFPIVGWVQALFGLTTLRSWCFGGHLGQCVAHYIMGSAFAAYGILLVIMMKAGVAWLARRGTRGSAQDGGGRTATVAHSQEYFDSLVLLAWGLVNAFTEHQGGPWTHKDLQHTMLGVVWVAGGLVGVWLSRGGRRTVWPGVILIITGWAMSGHAQALMISTMVHALFGYALMAAGLARIIEVCFVLDGRPSGEDSQQEGAAATPTRGRTSWYPIKAFQYLPPYLLVTAGILFMSATDEELRWADGQGLDHITWGLIDLSIAFVIFAWSNVLIDKYVEWGGRYGQRKDKQGSGIEVGPEEAEEYERLELRESTDGRPRASSGFAAGARAAARSVLPAIATGGGGGSSSSGSNSPPHHQPPAYSNAVNGKAHSNGKAEPEPQHVLFDDEDEEDRDPFAEEEDGTTRI